MSKEVTFNIKAMMNERWADDFCSMLNWMQRCGDLRAFIYRWVLFGRRW